MKSHLLLSILFALSVSASAQTTKGICLNASIQPEIMSVKDYEKPDYHATLYGIGAGVNLRTRYFQSSLHLGFGTTSTTYDRNGARNMYISHSGNEVMDIRHETGSYIYAELAGMGSIDVWKKVSVVAGLKARIDHASDANTEGIFCGGGPTAGVQYHLSRRMNLKGTASYLYSLSITRGWQGAIAFEF